MIRSRKISEIATVDEYREYFKINENWMLEWIKPKGPTKAGKVVEYSSKGYYIVTFKRKTYLVHRVIWALHYGEHPPSDKEIDHIDGNPSNNNIANLRLCNRQQNTRNRSSNKVATSKFKGVNYDSTRKKWYASGCDASGKYKSLGRHNTEIEAALAFNEFAKKEHGEFARLNQV